MYDLPQTKSNKASIKNVIAHERYEKLSTISVLICSKT